MMKYEWPGNVRELENTIQRAMILSDTDIFKRGMPFDEYPRANDADATADHAPSDACSFE